MLHMVQVPEQDEANPLLVKLGAAIRSARGKWTQTEVAALVGTDQGTMSRWERNEQRVPIEMLPTIEDAIGRPRGWILIHAGLVELPSSTEDAIDIDPRIDDGARWLLKGSLAGLIASRG